MPVLTTLIIKHRILVILIIIAIIFYQLKNKHLKKLVYIKCWIIISIKVGLYNKLNNLLKKVKIYYNKFYLYLFSYQVQKMN